MKSQYKKSASHTFLFLVCTILVLQLIIDNFQFSIPLAEAQTTATRCTTTGTTKFLRFNYVPRASAGYLENKSIIYIPKEAQCQGEFPLYIHLPGNNGRNDVSKYYLPRGTPGGQRSTEFGTPPNEVAAEHGPQVGTGEFQSAIETSMRNRNIPGTIFVIPANSLYEVMYAGLDGPALKQAVQQALDSNPETSGLRIRVGNQTLISGHSGAGCRGNNSGILQLTNMQPLAVGIIDTCTNIYAETTRRYASSTIVLYAAWMAYVGARTVGGVDQGGYHNEMQTLGFQALTTCDPQIYIGAPTATTRSRPPPYSNSFHHYWETPQLPCAKHPSHNWYGVFANSTDHVAAVATGVRTLLNVAYNNSPAPTTGASAPPSAGSVPAGNVPPQSVGTTAVVPTQTQFTGGSDITLEAPFGNVTAISGSGGGYIINYTKVLFAFIAGLVGLIALLMLIIAGVQIIIAGNEQQNTQAKERIIGALAGLVVLAMGGWILYIINPCFFTFEDTQTCTRRIITQTTFVTTGGEGQALPSVPTGSVVNAPPAPRGTWISPIYNTFSEPDRTRLRNAFMFNQSSQFQPLPSPLPNNPIEAIMAVIDSQLRTIGTFHPNFTTCNPISAEFMSSYCGMFCNLYVTWIYKHSGLPYPRNPGNVSTLRSYVLGKTMNRDETVNDHFWYIPVAPVQTAGSITQADVDRSVRPTYSPDRPQAGDIVFFKCNGRAATSGTSSEAAGNDCHTAIVVAASGNSFKWIENDQAPAKHCDDFHGHCGHFDVVGFGRLRTAPQTTQDYSSRFAGKAARQRAGARVGTPTIAADVTFLLTQLGLRSDQVAAQKLTEWATALVGTTGRGNRNNPHAPGAPETFFAGTALANHLNEIFFERGTSPSR